jgi:CheY-like chemotaxis protein
MIESEKADFKANNGEAKNQKVILVAEDDEVSFILLESLLSGDEYQLLWAKDGEEAVEIFNKVKHIDFVLMDLKMPKMGGIEATRQIRKQNTKIPIIAQTAYALEGDREMALEAGCNEYISKPIDCDLFDKLIQKYC